MTTQEIRFGTLIVADIIRDERLQLRTKVTQTTVKKYAEALQSGASFPPIKVADIGGDYYLVDGWHRVAAHELCFRDVVEAEIYPCPSITAALLMATTANLTHGRPLTTKEKRKAVNEFIRNEGHIFIKASGRKALRTYRELGELFQLHHTTMRNWVQRDFPELAEAMSRASAKEHGRPYPKPSETDMDEGSHYTPPPPNPDAKSLIVLKSYFGHIRNRFMELKTVDGAVEAVRELSALRDELADHMAHAFPPPENPDF